MSRKIKLHTFRTLFLLFAYLADKTGGWRVFVRPKLLLGSLIVGLGLTSCGTKTENKTTEKRTTSNSSKKEISKTDRITNNENKSIPLQLTKCYTGSVIIKDTNNEEKTIQEDKNKIFKIAEQMPEFPNGNDSLFSYVSRNLKWPNTDADVQGKVICLFVVNIDGSISDIEIIRSLDPLFDAEAIRVIKTMPKWIPGKHNGKTVRVQYTLPIIFRTQD